MTALILNLAVQRLPESPIKEQLQRQVRVDASPRGKVLSGVQALIQISLFVIACIAASGGLSGPVTGGLLLGGIGGLFLCEIAKGSLKDRKWYLLLQNFSSILSLTLGALGVAGVMTGVQIGWVIIGIPLAALGLGCFCVCCCALPSIGIAKLAER